MLYIQRFISFNLYIMSIARFFSLLPMWSFSTLICSFNMERGIWVIGECCQMVFLPKELLIIIIYKRFIYLFIWKLEIFHALICSPEARIWYSSQSATWMALGGSWTIGKLNLDYIGCQCYKQQINYCSENTGPCVKFNLSFFSLLSDCASTIITNSFHRNGTLGLLGPKL